MTATMIASVVEWLNARLGGDLLYGKSRDMSVNYTQMNDMALSEHD